MPSSKILVGDVENSEIVDIIYCPCSGCGCKTKKSKDQMIAELHYCRECFLKKFAETDEKMLNGHGPFVLLIVFAGVVTLYAAFAIIWFVILPLFHRYFIWW